MYLTVTSTSVSSVKSGTVTVAVSSTVTVAPCGNLPVNVESSIAFFAFASTFSFAFSLSPFLGTRISSASGFGNTVTGTFTVSSPFAYLTLVGTVTSVAPTLSFVFGKSTSIGSCTVPPSPGFTASFTLSTSGLSPSTTYTGSAFEPTTFTVIAASFVYLTPSTV